MNGIKIYIEVGHESALKVGILICHLMVSIGHNVFALY